MQLELTMFLEQEPGDGSSYQKLVFRGSALVVPVMIVVAGAGTPQSLKYAQQLHQDLKAEFQILSLQPDNNVEFVSDPLVEAQRALPETQRLLVLVGEKGEQPPQRLHHNTTRLHEAWLNQSPVNHGSSYSLLPVYPEKSPVTELLPGLKSLQEINVRFWRDAIAETVPDILAASGLTTRDFRIFVSYRRWQTTALAHQLFSELNKYAFDVFLDQFRVEAGVNFQEKLIEDLADKSMVLLLESSDFLGSEWTREEILFTKTNRLGLLAIKVPDNGTGIPQINAHERATLKPEDFENGYRVPLDKDHPETNLLTADALKRLMERVRSEHGRAFLRRRQQTREEMICALRLAGVPPVDFDFRADGFLKVERPNHSYFVWLASRPPELPDFHLSHLACPTPKHTVIIGLSKYMAVGRKSRIDWLASVSSVRHFDEGQMSHIADDIAKERL